ncbi:MAG TPA: DUF2911 domain-containing protein [Thermoanaerobaculia bacterium]|nr:DUF2911 domain-containing protein [Thermoanaerobaculia bacterium]
MVGRKLGTAALAMLACAGLAVAQEQRRAPSPPGTASTMVGGTWSAPDKEGERRYEGGKWIEVIYSRPMLRGRTDIFGKGADYGKMVNAGAPVWRAGANASTKLKTEVPLEIGGKKLAPGEYDLFVELKEGAWTLIVSTQPTQEKYDANDKTKIWGSYGYDPKFDVVRVPMKMITPQVSVEQFTIGFADMTNAGGKLAMVWEKTGGVVPFTIGK